MTKTITDKTRGGAPIDRIRKTAFWSGVLYLLTFVSIPALALYVPVMESGYIAGSGPDTGVLVGGLLELIVGLACIGTAVALYPVVKRQNEGLAMGFVGARVLEAATIFVGVASLWTIVTLRQTESAEMQCSPERRWWRSMTACFSSDRASSRR